jgi:hypothetical protein
MSQLQDSMDTMYNKINNLDVVFRKWKKDVDNRLPSRNDSNIMVETKPEESSPLSQPLVTIVNGAKLGINHSANTSLQSEHFTPAHMLLEEWTGIREWLKGNNYLKSLVPSGRQLSDYAMQLEQDRGLLRLWGVGEGPGNPEGSSNLDTPSPGPEKEGLWGCPPWNESSLGITYSSAPGEYYSHAGGLGPDGQHDFRSAVIDELLESYMTNMHSLHPFLNRSKIQEMFRVFKGQYSPDAKPTNATSAAFHQLNPATLILPREQSSGLYATPLSY